jgi:hypothetical protein
MFLQSCLKHAQYAYTVPCSLHRTLHVRGFTVFADNCTGSGSSFALFSEKEGEVERNKGE